MIQIKHRHTNKVLFEGDYGSLKETLAAAVAKGADLRGADLYGANLRGANLTAFRDDIWAVLSSNPAEVPALLEALQNGQVDGSTYTGDCACLVGTIANAKQCDYQELPNLKPDSSRLAEVWFCRIGKGDTPETSETVRQTVEWVETWLDGVRAAFGK